MNGGVPRQSRWVSISRVLAGEYVGFGEIIDGIWALDYAPVLPGGFDEGTRLIVSAHIRKRLKKPRPAVLPTYPCTRSKCYLSPRPFTAQRRGDGGDGTAASVRRASGL